MSTLDSSSFEKAAAGTPPEALPTAATTGLNSGASLSPPVGALSSSVGSETDLSAMGWWAPQGTGDLSFLNSRLEQDLGFASTGQWVNTPIDSTQGASPCPLDFSSMGHEARAAAFDIVGPNNSWDTHATSPMGPLWTTALDPGVYSSSEARTSFPVAYWSLQLPSGFPGDTEQIHGGAHPNRP